MSKAGAVGGITPAIPAGPQDGGAKAAVQTSDAKAAEGKSSAPPLAEASNRAPPDAAVELSAAFAGLKPGQELRGTVRLLPGQYVELTLPRSTNALTVRYSIPDAPGGGGMTAPCGSQSGTRPRAP